MNEVTQELEGAPSSSSRSSLLTDLEVLLTSLPSELKGELLELLRKETYLDENDVLIKVIRAMGVFGVFFKGLEIGIRESLHEAKELCGKGLQEADLDKLEEQTYQLRELVAEIEDKHTRARGASYAVHSLALVVAFLQGLMMTYLIDTEWRLALLGLVIFILGMSVSSFLKRSWRLIHLWAKRRFD